MMNQGQCAARLGRSDVVYDVLSRMTTRQYVYPSFMISYWPGLNGFGFDPVGTIPDVLNNALIFGWKDTVDLLPALPREWPIGSINGLLLREQIQVQQLAWNIPAGKLSLNLLSRKDQTITLQLPPGIRIRSAAASGSATIIDQKSQPNRRRLTLLKAKPTQVEITFAPEDFTALWKTITEQNGASPARNDATGN